MEKQVRLSNSTPPVARLGLATRGDTSLQAEDCHLALERGVNYWNWCGREDGMSRAVRELGANRNQVVLAVQMEATRASQAKEELDNHLRTLATDRIEGVTLYYMETRAEWDRVRAKGGALDFLRTCKREGTVGLIGVTTHQRPLAVEIAASGEMDLLMIRYNAAHRGAESEVLPLCDRLRLPTVAFTCLRWGALIEHPRAPGWQGKIPSASDCYRFVLSNPSVSVALMAPDNRDELKDNLRLLEDWRELSVDERRWMREWGDFVHATGGQFP